MKEMDKGRHILDIEITRNHSKKFLSLSQEAYINKILKHFRMYYSKPVDTPVKKDLTLNLDQCPKINKETERMSNVPYASAVESLTYAMLCTRPNIYFAIGLVGRYQSNPRFAQ